MGGRWVGAGGKGDLVLTVTGRYLGGGEGGGGAYPGLT